MGCYIFLHRSLKEENSSYHSTIPTINIYLVPQYNKWKVLGIRRASLYMKLNIGKHSVIKQWNLETPQMSTDWWLPESETPHANCWDYQMISWHLHHTQEHNSLHHGRKPLQDFEIFPVRLCPKSESMQLHTVSLKQWMIQDMLFLNNLSKSKEIITLLTSIEPFTENKGQNYQCTEGLY